MGVGTVDDAATPFAKPQDVPPIRAFLKAAGTPAAGDKKDVK
jgi:hypothetical protein